MFQGSIHGGVINIRVKPAGHDISKMLLLPTFPLRFEGSLSVTRVMRGLLYPRCLHIPIQFQMFAVALALCLYS